MKSPDKELCNVCPRNCNADKSSENSGYCNTDYGFLIGSVCIHEGEEPVLCGNKGICNVFFGHCNLQCIYCQNYQISDNYQNKKSDKYSLDEVLSSITAIMKQGIRHIGFVSASHCIRQIIHIINELKKTDYRPVFIYNSNGYDKSESLRMLEGLIDIYLPDFKYADNKLSEEYSDVSDYKERALEAILEMYRQKGSVLHTDADGMALSGLIIRHLVLPGSVENSKDVLRLIAGELSANIHISLMSQYYPTKKVSKHPYLKRKITHSEYKEVLREMEMLGFSKGWIQDSSSAKDYQPDFNKKHPFEK